MSNLLVHDRLEDRCVGAAEVRSTRVWATVLEPFEPTRPEPPRTIDVSHVPVVVATDTADSPALLGGQLENHQVDQAGPLLAIDVDDRVEHEMARAGKQRLNIMDFYVRRGDKLHENWVLIDMVDFAAQCGVDLLAPLGED